MDRTLRGCQIECMSKNENVLECLTIEIHIKETNNIVLSCIYGTLGS